MDERFKIASVSQFIVTIHIGSRIVKSIGFATKKTSFWFFRLIRNLSKLSFFLFLYVVQKLSAIIKIWQDKKEKLQGIVFDTAFKLYSHTSKIYKKDNQQLSLLSRMKKVETQKQRSIILKSFFMSLTLTLYFAMS